ncbi:MAG: protein kinase [Myxococcaceae bacterium]|nr:protein kinase [Myxococcaceae bacterium]
MESTVICGACGKVLANEPNFCPACGADLRGLSPTADTLSGPLNGQVLDGRYRIIEKLGEGGMGTVFKVEHVRMGKILALKVLDPDHALDRNSKARFKQEARVVAKLSHPNTVQVFDTGELEDGSLFIAMEYLPGRDLAWHLRAHGPMTEERAIHIGIGLLQSLSEAHGLGIVHRDLKPANVMLVRRKDSDDQVKLLDFGIAKLNETESKKHTTGVNEFIGTPSYMSPEQGRGEPLDARSDLYSLGAMLFELVAGRGPFVGETPMSVVTMHLTQMPPRVATVAPGRTVSPAFEAVLSKALTKEREHRFSSADAMRAALEKARRELGAFPGDFTPVPDELEENMVRRSDFDAFERSLRVRRVLTPLLVITVLVLLVASTSYYFWGAHSGGMTHEVEPNNDPAQANPIALGADVTGTIGAANQGEKSERDLFIAQVAGGPVRVTLSGVEDLNLTLELLQLEKQSEGGGEKLVRRVLIDDQGPSLPERIDAFDAKPGALYLRVEENGFFTEPPRKAREKSRVPYTLKVEAIEDASAVETEPNDTLETATAAPLSRPLTGYLGAVLPDIDALVFERPTLAFSSPDFFKVETGDESEKVGVLVVPPASGKILALDAAAFESWQQKRATGTTPTARTLPAPGSVVVEKKPALLLLKPGSRGRGVRIAAGEGSQPGATYQLAFLTDAPNGLASVIDLARQLEAQGRSAERQKVLEMAANHFASSSQVAQVKALLK